MTAEQDHHSTPKTLTIPKVGDICVWCHEPVGLHNGIKAMNCLHSLAQATVADRMEALGMERSPSCPCTCWREVRRGY